MERLFRLGHQASLTLGNAKTIDIFTTPPGPDDRTFKVSVKSIRGGGKWGIGTTDYTADRDLIFVLLHYRNFEELKAAPDVWIMPASAAMALRRPWLGDSFAMFCGNAQDRSALEPYRDAWHFLASASTGGA